jgi:hypothetical protein
MKLKHYILSLTWWKSHELQLPNISFIARASFGIPRFQTKRIFGIAKVLTSLCRCKLEVENLDKLVIIMKIWSSNSKVECMCEGYSLDDFLTDEANIIGDNDVILDAIGYYNGEELE